jgi:hypothetical protein
MKNKITECYFVHDGICTIIQNPSPLIQTLMSGICVRPFRVKGKEAVYVHKDIGTQEEMEQLFQKLENVKN